MATEKYANNAASTLNGAITAGATSLTLISAAAFPATGNFRIIMESEIALVTARSGNVLTITRGQEGTAGAAHASGVAVTQILTAGAIDAMRADNIQSGTFASLPAAEKAGRLYIPTDSFYDYLRDTGSAWEYFLNGKKVTPPVFANFAWVNQGTATVTTTNGGIYFETPNQGGNTDNLRGFVENVPTAPYTRTLVMIPNIPLGIQGYPSSGVILYDGTKLFSLGVGWRQDGPGAENYRGSFINIVKWNSVSSWNSDVLIKPTSYFGPIWLRIEDDNTNRKCWISYNGINFIQIFSEARTTFLTPTKIGFYLNGNGIVNVGQTILSWQ